MASKINYNNKAPFQTLEEIPDENKVNAADMNEIKQVVNTNADELDTAKEDIENLESGQGTASADITSLKNRVSTLETDNETNKTNITNLQSNKVDKVEGKGLSTEDFTTELKSKLESLENYDDTEIKEDISNLEAEQTEQNEQIDILLNALPTETQEAENINIKGTIPVKFKEFKVSGNSKQETSDTMPSPEIPSEIQNVEENVNVSVCNRNLFDSKVFTSGSLITVNEDGSLTLANNVNTAGYINAGKKLKELCKGLKAGDLAYLKLVTTASDNIYLQGKSNQYWVSNNSKKITEDMLEDTVIIYGGYQKTDTLQIQITKNTLEDYVPHQEQVVTFPLSEGQKLYLGDYLAEDGIHHVRKQDTVTGTTKVFEDAKENGSYMCNIKEAGILNGKTITFNESVTNAIVEYELVEEEIEAYTEEQQEAYNQLKELQAYEEETNVFSTNEINPIFKVTAVKDVNSVITQLNQLILENGGN